MRKNQFRVFELLRGKNFSQVWLDHSPLDSEKFFGQCPTSPGAYGKA